DHRIRAGVIPHHAPHGYLPVLRVGQQLRPGVGVVVPEVGQIAEAGYGSGADAVHSVALSVIEVSLAGRKRVAHFGAGMDIFSIARFGDVVGHDGVGIVFGPFDEAIADVPPIGANLLHGEHGVTDRDALWLAIGPAVGAPGIP